MRATIKQFKNLIVLVLCILFLLTVVFNLHIIPTGYTGVRVKFGQIQEQPEQSGRLIITMPFADRIHKVNNKQQDFTAKNQIWGETDDKTPVYAKDVTVRKTSSMKTWWRRRLNPPWWSWGLGL